MKEIVKIQKYGQLRNYLLLVCSGMMSAILLTGCVTKAVSDSEWLIEEQVEYHHENHKEYPVGHVHHHQEEEQEETLWTLGKAEQLRQHMMAYRPPKEGRYQEYLVSKPLEWQSVQLPQQIIQNSSHSDILPIKVDGQTQKFLYSQTAEEEGWKIVAIFSNQEDELTRDKHTYLFAVNADQEPVVLELQMLQEQTVYVTSDIAPQVQELFTFVMKEN